MMRFQFDSEMVCFLSRLTSATLKIGIIVLLMWINLHLKNSNIIESESLMFLVRRRDMSYRLRLPTEGCKTLLRLPLQTTQHNWTKYTRILSSFLRSGRMQYWGFCAIWGNLLIWVEFAIKTPIDLYRQALLSIQSQECTKVSNYQSHHFGIL